MKIEIKLYLNNFSRYIKKKELYLKLVSLVPLVVPIPLIFLGLFTSGIQALIFATLSGSVCIYITSM